MPGGKIFKFLKGSAAKLGIKKLESQIWKIAARKAKKSIKSLLKKKGLPTGGKIRFIPREVDAKSGEVLWKDGGFVDKFGNIWRKPTGNIVGEMHWDVKLSQQGKKQLGWLSRSGNHINVSIDGKVVH